VKDDLRPPDSGPTNGFRVAPTFVADGDAETDARNFEIVQEGRVVASSDSANGTRRLSLKAKVRVDGHSWLAARCGGPDYFGSNHLDVWERGIFAHTSPVYVACGEDWWMFNEETARYMLTMIEGNLGYIRDQSHQHPHGTVSHHHGEPDHMAFLQRPLNEAREAMNKRLGR